MGEWGAIAISLGGMLIVGIVMTQLGIALDVANTDNEEINLLRNVINDGFEVDLGLWKFNFNIIPTFMATFIFNTIVGFSLIPAIIGYPLLVFFIVLFVYGLIKLLPTT